MAVSGPLMGFTARPGALQPCCRYPGGLGPAGQPVAAAQPAPRRRWPVEPGGAGREWPGSAARSCWSPGAAAVVATVGGFEGPGGSDVDHVSAAAEAGLVGAQGQPCAVLVDKLDLKCQMGAGGALGRPAGWGLRRRAGRG